MDSINHTGSHTSSGIVAAHQLTSGTLTAAHPITAASTSGAAIWSSGSWSFSGPSLLEVITRMDGSQCLRFGGQDVEIDFDEVLRFEVRRTFNGVEIELELVSEEKLEKVRESLQALTRE